MLQCNFEIGVNSINEFTRVLVEEAHLKPIVANFSYYGDKIVLDIEIEDKKGRYTYHNYEDKIEDIKVAILKVSIMKLYGKSYPWGGLIGVRPTKVVKRLQLLGYSYGEIKEIMEEIYLVSKEKTDLLLEIFKKELEIMNSSAVSVYIGIPFCPTKCKYCSFASFELGSQVGIRYYHSFVETLLEEIKLTGELLKENSMRLESIYIGGGTPSTLTESDLEKVLLAVRENFDFTHIREFTFEAGREDSITDEKLEIAKKHGVDRVSINPQTFNEVTLKNLNRAFSRENFDRCYNKMKELGFIINMDLILGLPGEKEEDICATLEEIKKYDIENLTIHSLALKKASILYKEEDVEISDLDRIKVENKVKEILKEKDLHPYYLYRQKNSAKWGENIGYSKLGFESLFNIEMIEENQSTIGVGGGAITKKITREDSNRDNVERVINPKDPATYIKEMKERFIEKKKLFSGDEA